MEQEIIKVGIAGFTGYTGLELLRILSKHPKVKITSLSSSTHYDKYLYDVLDFANIENIKITKELEDVDVVFLALPHEASLDQVPFYASKNVKIIDLSGAFRLKDKNIFKEYYNLEYKLEHESIVKEVVYGLPELFREGIRKANIVSNPGCYPTAVILGVLPIVKNTSYRKPIIVNAVSGVSGAGAKLKQEFHFPYMEQNAFYYGIGKHRHTPEMSLYLGLEVQFSPMVIPASRGMIANIKLFDIEEMDFKALYEDFYKDEPFVKLTDKPPHTKWVIGTNMCYIYIYYHKSLKMLEIISAIDNLGKGASSQAVQNMNIMFGLEETLGIDKFPVIP
jgi:N-acetyl-gamma-glutamyl-phosphate reductase